MLKKLFFSVIIILISSYSATDAKVLFYDNCEDAPAASEWRILGNGSNGKSFSVSNKQARVGTHSYKYVLPVVPKGSDTHIGSVLLKPAKHFKFNEVYWIGFSIYIPSNFDFPSERGNWVLGPQFHDTPDPERGVCDDWRNPMFSIHADNANQGFRVSILGQKEECSITAYPDAPRGRGYDRNVRYFSSALKKGAWNDIVLNFKFNYSTGGFFKVWLNGKLFTDDKGINCFNDDAAPYFYIGLYGGVDKATTVYYDEIRVGDKNSSHTEVSPRPRP